MTNTTQVPYTPYIEATYTFADQLTLFYIFIFCMFLLILLGYLLFGYWEYRATHRVLRDWHSKEISKK